MTNQGKKSDSIPPQDSLASLKKSGVYEALKQEVHMALKDDVRAHICRWAVCCMYGIVLQLYAVYHHHTTKLKLHLFLSVPKGVLYESYIL